MANPVEANVVTRFILGLAVIFAMMLGGGVVGRAFETLEFQYAGAIGVAVGALAVLLGFVVLYTRYDASVVERE